MKILQVISFAILLFSTLSHGYDICESDEECFMSKTIKDAFLYSVTTRDAKPEIELDYSYKNADGLIMALGTRDSDYARKELVSLADYYFGDRYEDVLNIMIQHQSKGIIPFLNRAKNTSSICTPENSKYCRSEMERLVYINKLIEMVKTDS